jgi:Phage stabilisation protein
MAMDPSNPFANSAAIPAGVQGIQPKLGTPQPQVTVIPTVPPGGFSQEFATADQADILASLQYVVDGIANNQFLTLNQTQINAISSIYTDWSATAPYGTTLPGVVTVPAPALQNTVIAMQAINYLQTTGLLTTTQDLIDSNGQIQMVTGFAPNGASTLTIHNQKVLCAVPNTPFWYASNVGDAGNGGWNPLSAGDMETYSDQPLAVDQCYGYAVAFGAQSMEWYQDVGNQPFPYVIVPGAAYQIGLPAVFSRANFMGNIVFLGRYKTGQMHVMETNGTGLPVIISTPDIDQIINNFPNGQYQDAIASTDDFNGHPVFILTFPSAKRTFLYDGVTEIWSELQSSTMEYQRHLVTLRATLNNGTLGSDYESGNVYFIDPNNYTDNGFIIPRVWVSKHVRNNGNLFEVEYLEVVMDVGNGSQKTSLPVPFTACPKIELFVSTDGGKIYRKPRAMEIGEVGRYRTKVFWRSLGQGYDFIFKFRCTDPVPFVIVAGYATINPRTPQ